MVEEEIAKLRILNDIYKNENAYIKEEYRKLYDKYIIEKNKNDNRNLFKVFKKIIKKILRKIKGLIKHG